jgi:hypothetical protein
VAACGPVVTGLCLTPDSRPIGASHRTPLSAMNGLASEDLRDGPYWRAPYLLTIDAPGIRRY